MLQSRCEYEYPWDREYISGSTRRLVSRETQEDLAKVLQKNRVAVSDLERGRVSVNASDLGFIAAYYDKTISYFYPPRLKIDKDDLSSLDEELLMIFWQLPEIQQHIALEYVKQQLEVVYKAESRSRADKLTNISKDDQFSVNTSIIDMQDNNLSFYPAFER